MAEAIEISRGTEAAAMDALHLAAAIRMAADEFVTGEKNTKPVYRETRVRVKHIKEV